MIFLLFLGALSWLLLIFSAPITFPILSSLWLAQAVVQEISRLPKYKSLGIKEPVVSLDTLFVIDDFQSNPNGANAIVCIIEGPIDLNKVCSKFGRLLTTNEGYDRLHSLLPTANFFGFPFWTSVNSTGVELKSTFNVKNHFMEDMSEICGNLELDKYLVKYFKRPFPRDQPCWDILYLNSFWDDSVTGVSKIQKSVLVVRNHHVVGDGIFLLNLFIKMSDDFNKKKSILYSPEQSTDFKIRACGTVPQSTSTDRVVKKLNKKLNFEKFLQLYWAPLQFFNYSQHFGLHKDFTTAKKKCQKVAICRTKISLDNFKTIRKQHFGSESLGTLATQNWILSGALRQLFRREFGDASAYFGSTRVAASLLWKDKKTPKSISQFKNQFTVGTFKIPLNEPCRFKRKHIVLQNCRMASKCRIPQAFRYSLALNRLLPIAALQSMYAFNLGCTSVISNLSGPQHPVYIDSKKVLELWPIVGIARPHAAMTNCLLSYNGTIWTTFLIKKQFLPSGNTCLPGKDFENEVKSIITSSKNIKDV